MFPPFRSTEVRFADAMRVGKSLEGIANEIKGLGEGEGLKAALRAIGVADPLAADFVESTIAKFQMIPDRNLPELPDDITAAEIPAGAAKRQLAIQELTSAPESVIRYNPRYFNKLSPSDRVLFRIHEAYLKARYIVTHQDGLSTGEIREKVALLAASPTFALFLDRAVCEKPKPQKGRVLIGVSFSMSIRDLNVRTSSDRSCLPGGFRHRVGQSLSMKGQSRGDFALQLECLAEGCRGQATFKLGAREIALNSEDFPTPETRRAAGLALYAASRDSKFPRPDGAFDSFCGSVRTALIIADKIAKDEPDTADNKEAVVEELAHARCQFASYFGLTPPLCEPTAPK